MSVYAREQGIDMSSLWVPLETPGKQRPRAMCPLPFHALEPRSEANAEVITMTENTVEEEMEVTRTIGSDPAKLERKERK